MKAHKSLAEKKEECLALLRSTNRNNIEKIITHIEKMGYFEAPGSESHHRFEGGLVSHSLETCHKALVLRENKISNGTNPDKLPIESVIIASLLHDVCKADKLRFNKETRKVYAIKKTNGHSQRSVRQIGYSGFVLSPEEKDAILWHMGGKHFNEDRHRHFAQHPLSEIIFYADKKSIHEASLRHHPSKKSK